MFLSCSSCLVLEGWSNAVFLNISIWQSVYFYISCIFHVFCFLRIVYIVSFFLQAFFNEFVIHGLSGLLFFTVSCVQLLTGQFELYKFVNKLMF